MPLILFLVLLVPYLVFSRETSQYTSLYEQTKTQCLDRFDKEKCLAYFDRVLQASDPLLKESNTRKELRYAELREEKNDPFGRFFLEEFDYGTRRIDIVKQKALHAMERRAKQSLIISKEAATALLDQSRELDNKAICADLDEEECQDAQISLQDMRHQYFSHVVDGVGHGITAMMAYVQKSLFLTESDAALLNSELNQALARVRLFRAKIQNAPLTDSDITDLSSLISANRGLQSKISLLHAYGHLFSLSRLLSVMHIKWERKLAHLLAAQDAEEFLPRIMQFSVSLDNAIIELHEAAELIPVKKEKRVVVHLSQAYALLAEATNEQKEMIKVLGRKGIVFASPYDLLEEAVDNHAHGIETEMNTRDEPALIAKLYPEKGYTLVVVSQEPLIRYSFSTIDEEKLIELIAEKTKQDKDAIKQQLRFEVGGK